MSTFALGQLQSGVVTPLTPSGLAGDRAGRYRGRAGAAPGGPDHDVGQERDRDPQVFGGVRVLPPDRHGHRHDRGHAEGPDLSGPRMLLVLGRRGQSLALDKSGRGQGGQAAYQDVPGDDVDRERVSAYRPSRPLVNGISVVVNSNAKFHHASPSLCPVTTLVSPPASGQPPSSDTRVHGRRVATWHGSIPAVPTYSTLRGISERFRYGL